MRIITALSLVLAISAAASGRECDIRPELPPDSARRVLAACAAESRQEEAPRAESDLFRWLGRAHYPAKLADFASTEMALTRDGVREANPLMEHRGVRAAALVAVPVATNWATAELYQDGHEGWALVLRIAAVALPSVLTVNNLLQR